MGNIDLVDFQKRAALLDGLGVLDFEGLRRIADVAVPWVIDGLMTERSVNILAGDSGIGKTPLATMASIHMAAGQPFLGHVTRQGPVLYFAGEGDVTQFTQMVQVLSETAGLDRPPPDLRVWAPSGARVTATPPDSRPSSSGPAPSDPPCLGSEELEGAPPASDSGRSVNAARPTPLMKARRGAS